VNSVETLDATWLARGGGQRAPALLRQAWHWRARRYDLAINFEADIRSNGLLWLSGATRRVGFTSGGGGAFLTDAIAFDTSHHVATNAIALVERAFDLSPGTLGDPRAADRAKRSRLVLPDSARAGALACLTQIAGGSLPSALIALHVGSGRAVKQWPPSRFADVAATLAKEQDAVVVLTGSAEDDALVTAAAARLTEHGVRTLRVAPVDLMVLAGVLTFCRLLISGDTGPMHLAAAVGTPVLAVFGPSMPWRYAPLVAEHRIVRIDLPCSPCNRIRRPPLRCQGRVPECLQRLTIDPVIAAGRALLAMPAVEPRT
jgi:ADP-heptose:LPS heptosyltransferase